MERVSEMKTTKEKCGDCQDGRIEWDKDEYVYMPYCWKYNTWLDYDKRFSVNLTEEHAYRSRICFEWSEYPK